MQADEFRQRFMLHQTAPPERRAATDIHQAAVLVPVIDYGKQLKLLFTQRALHLRHHPGQVSFPGGRIELNETPAEAALREAHEEIGLLSQHVDLLGTLPLQPTSTGFTIIPWVALVKPQAQWLLEPNEVADIFEVPLEHFLQQQNRHQFSLPLAGKTRLLHAMPYRGRFIWGATAAIMHQLCIQLL